MLTNPIPANLGSTTKTNKTETNKDKSEAKEGSFQSIKLKSSFNLSQTGEYNKLSLALTPIIVTGVMVFYLPWLQNFSGASQECQIQRSELFLLHLHQSGQKFSGGFCNTLNSQLAPQIRPL